MTHRPEFNAILKQVEGWPPEDRRALAMELLGGAGSAPNPPPPRDTLALARAIAASVTRPPPSDEEVERWIHEHRMAKYGGGVR